VLAALALGAVTTGPALAAPHITVGSLSSLKAGAHSGTLHGTVVNRSHRAAHARVTVRVQRYGTKARIVGRASVRVAAERTRAYRVRVKVAGPRARQLLPVRLHAQRARRGEPGVRDGRARPQEHRPAVPGDRASDHAGGADPERDRLHGHGQLHRPPGHPRPARRPIRGLGPQRSQSFYTAKNAADLVGGQGTPAGGTAFEASIVNSFAAIYNQVPIADIRPEWWASRSPSRP
jgi:hypothetical protein